MSENPFRKYVEELRRALEQSCKDLNEAHDQIMRMQDKNPDGFDWPEWTPQANTIRWAERLLGKRLAKTNAWTEYPDPPKTN